MGCKMICYKCDMCDIEIMGRVHSIELFPRKIDTNDTYIINSQKKTLYTYDVMPTHLCDNCFKKIANMLSCVEVKK